MQGSAGVIELGCADCAMQGSAGVTELGCADCTVQGSAGVTELGCADCAVQGSAGVTELGCADCTVQGSAGVTPRVQGTPTVREVFCRTVARSSRRVEWPHANCYQCSCVYTARGYL
jgi:Uri superfamily endonuclease